jgi:hypothetical protein
MCGKQKKDLYHLRGFENLVYDAVYLMYLAHDVDPEQDKDGYQFTYSRSSILNTLLLFECGANCCIDALNLPGQFEDDIEKLPFLSKYEFFLNRIKPKKQFDRGCEQLKAVADLKRVRDSYVHPKVRKKEYSKVDDFFGPDFKASSFLNIPNDSAHWSGYHAALALKTANDFFNLFFLNWCEFDTDTVCEILLSSDPAGIPATSSIFVDGIDGLGRASLDWGIDFKFIGKVLPQ